MVQFAPNSAQGIRGGHSGPANEWDWLVSCFGGVTEPCTASCGAALRSVPPLRLEPRCSRPLCFPLRLVLRCVRASLCTARCDSCCGLCARLPLYICCESLRSHRIFRLTAALRPRGCSACAASTASPPTRRTRRASSRSSWRRARASRAARRPSRWWRAARRPPST
eukprot:117201-Prymnesium_polylepis.1